MFVLLSNWIKVLTPGINSLKDIFPNFIATNNFEQVLGMVKQRELSRLCVYMDAYNFSGSDTNIIRGQTISQEVHKINSDIPILVWSGRLYKPDEGMELFSSELLSSGIPTPLPNDPHTIYRTADSDILDVTCGFFKGLSYKNTDV